MLDVFIYGYSGAFKVKVKSATLGHGSAQLDKQAESNALEESRERNIFVSPEWISKACNIQTAKFGKQEPAQFNCHG